MVSLFSNSRIPHREEVLESILDLFKSKAKDGYVPKVLSGSEIYEYYLLENELNENYLFNTLCYTSPYILGINPGDAIMSERWIDNRYGLLEPYLSQLRRECKLEFILKSVFK